MLLCRSGVRGTTRQGQRLFLCQKIMPFMFMTVLYSLSADSFIFSAYLLNVLMCVIWADLAQYTVLSPILVKWELSHVKVIDRSAHKNIHCVSKNWTLQLTSRNFTNSQRSVIIFGIKRLCSILH